jgi:hypothetical protein
VQHHPTPPNSILVELNIMANRRASPEFDDSRPIGYHYDETGANQDGEIPDYFLATEGFGGDVSTSNLDLVLSVLVTFGLPISCRFLFELCGNKAWASLLLYYFCCTVLVRWRRGTLDFTVPFPPVNRKIVLLFLIGVLIAAGSAYKNYRTLVPRDDAFVGVLLTVLIWVTLNSALEQLSWLYVLDAWRNRWRFDHTYSFNSKGRAWRSCKQSFGTAIGYILFFALIGMQHTLFWVLFLPVPSTNSSAAGAGRIASTLITIALNLGTAGIYSVIYREHKSVWLLWILHFLTDAQLVILGRYSIFHDLV